MSRKSVSSAKEGSITHLKDGRVRLRITRGTKIINDKKTGLPKKIKNTKDFFGHTEAECREKFKKWDSEKSERSYTTYEERLVMECIYEWITEVKSLTLKAPSYARLIQVTDDYVSPRLGVYRVHQVTADVIQVRVINDMKRQGYSFSTIKKTVNVLTGFFRWAVGTQKVNFNPCPALILPSEKLIKEEKGQTDEIKYYTREEILKLKEAAEAENVYHKEMNQYKFPRAYAFLFIIYTGLRGGEMLALKWSDYDPVKKTITVSKDVAEYKDPETRRIVTKLQMTPKTSSSYRTLKLNDEAIEILRKIKERSFDPTGEFIVSNRNRGRNGSKSYVAPSNFRGSFRRFCLFAGVEYKGVHALRHTFASMLFAQGVPPKVISEFLGHASIVTTLDVYTHIMEELGVNSNCVIPPIELKK